MLGTVTVVAVIDPFASTTKGAVALFAKVSPDQKTTSVPALAEFIPAKLEPVPTEIFAVLAAPEVKVKLVADKVVEPIVKPPIAPDVEVSAPAAVTLNGAVARLANVSPDQKVISPLALAEFIPAEFNPVPTVMLATLAAPEVRTRLVAVIVLVAIVKLAIAPDVAVIFPAMVAVLATRFPNKSTEKGAVEKVELPKYIPCDALTVFRPSRYIPVSGFPLESTATLPVITPPVI